jgi:hypothetical protein
MPPAVLKKWEPKRPPKKIPYILPGTLQTAVIAADVFTQFEPLAISHANAALIGIDIKAIGMNIKNRELTFIRLNNKIHMIAGIAKIRCPTVVTDRNVINGISGNFVVILTSICSIH